MGGAQRKTGRRVRRDFPARAPAAPLSPGPASGDCAERAHGPPARFVAPGRMTWRPFFPNTRAPCADGAMAHPTLARRIRAGRALRSAPRRAFSIASKPKASAGQRRELLRCIIPRCFFFRIGFFLAQGKRIKTRAISGAADGAGQPPLGPGRRAGNENRIQSEREKKKAETGRNNKGRREARQRETPAQRSDNGGRRSNRKPRNKKRQTQGKEQGHFRETRPSKGFPP